MKDFETFYTELISDTLWYELLRHYKAETVRKSAEKVYAQLVADKTVGIRPMSENRKHVYNMTCKLPGDKPKIDWVSKARKEIELEKEKEWEPASPEHIDKCVKEFEEMMANTTMLNHFPRIGYKQSIEEGGWLPKKQDPYPSATPEEVYVRQRHLEYVKQNYEARTAAKLPGWISEDEWNIQYDNDMIDK